MSGDPIRWHTVAPIADARARAPMAVDVDGLEIAVFQLDDGFRAVGNSCPHAGGPLAEGLVADGCVECPWHGWRFDIRTGACHTAPARAVTYPTRERDGVLEVGVPAT